MSLLAIITTVNTSWLILDHAVLGVAARIVTRKLKGTAKAGTPGKQTGTFDPSLFPAPEDE
jgi:hypothetical protein